MGVDVVHLHSKPVAERGVAHQWLREGCRACQQAQEPAITGWVRQAKHRLQGRIKHGTGKTDPQALHVRSTCRTIRAALEMICT